jgi:hypothetical protein
MRTMKNLRIAGLWAGIRTWDLPNMKQECQQPDRNVLRYYIKIGHDELLQIPTY